jgi:hypothetical protein
MTLLMLSGMKHQDYQLAAGISKDVEADDSILEHTKARLPWLVLSIGRFYLCKSARII